MTRTSLSPTRAALRTSRSSWPSGTWSSLSHEVAAYATPWRDSSAWSQYPNYYCRLDLQTSGEGHANQVGHAVPQELVPSGDRHGLLEPIRPCRDCRHLPRIRRSPLRVPPIIFSNVGSFANDIYCSKGDFDGAIKQYIKTIGTKGIHRHIEFPPRLVPYISLLYFRSVRCPGAVICYQTIPRRTADPQPHLLPREAA